MKKANKIKREVELKHTGSCKRLVGSHRGTGGVDGLVVDGTQTIEIWNCSRDCPLRVPDKVYENGSKICGIIILMF
jgi:hypothetical protein